MSRGEAQDLSASYERRKRILATAREANRETKDRLRHLRAQASRVKPQGWMQVALRALWPEGTWETEDVEQAIHETSTWDDQQARDSLVGLHTATLADLMR